MAYDIDVLKAPSGMVRVVTYTRAGTQEFLRVQEDVPTFREGLRVIASEEKKYPDPDATRRTYMVYGIFNERGYAIFFQEPCNWPGNRWNNNYQLPLPELFENAEGTVR